MGDVVDLAAYRDGRAKLAVNPYRAGREERHRQFLAQMAYAEEMAPRAVEGLRTRQVPAGDVGSDQGCVCHLVAPCDWCLTHCEHGVNIETYCPDCYQP